MPPPRVEEIIGILFLTLKRRAAREEKKARVVDGGTVIFSKDDAFGGDGVRAGDDGGNERRSPTALCISLLLFPLKTLSLFCLVLTFFLKGKIGRSRQSAHVSHVYLITFVISTSFLGDTHTHTLTHLHTQRERERKRENKDALLLCLFGVAAQIIHKDDDGGFSLIVLVFLFWVWLWFAQKRARNNAKE